jgi:hypothetical protein
VSFDTHPDELDLMEYVDGVADPHLQTHLSECSVCQDAADEFADAVPLPNWDSVLDAVDAAVSPSVLAALDTPVPGRVEAGQLWRARWDDATQLVYVVAAEAATCRLAPISLDVHLAGPNVRTVDADDSPLGIPFGAWTARTVQARQSVLELFLGRLEHTLGIDRDASSYELAALDDRSLFAGRLEERLVVLAMQAAWEPTSERDSTSLSMILQRAHINLTEMAALLDVNTATALDLWRGDRTLSAQQLAALDEAAAARGATMLPSAATSSDFPDDLLDELTQPLWKAPVLAARTRGSTTETAARQAAAAAAVQLSLAARRQRRAAMNWAEVLGRVLR